MKKLTLIILASFAVLATTIAQNVDDALRYSQVFYSGTARFNSLGGAFTALGGDLSSLSLNPAGLGLFRSSEISITPQLFNFKSSAFLFGTNSNDFLYNFNLGQIGIVANLINNNQENGLITLNLGYSYNSTSNLNQTISINGVPENSSLLDYFARKLNSAKINKNDLTRDFLNQNNLNDLLDAFLAWDTYLLDTLPGSNTSYGTVYSGYGDNPYSVYGQHMRRNITSEGGTGEHAFSIGGNYSNKIYFGLTFGISKISYDLKYNHIESTDSLLTSKFTDFNYSYYSQDRGTGYSVKFGMIYKPVETVRVGFAFQSPTYYRIHKVIGDNISSRFTIYSNPITSSNEASRFDYALTTPFKAEFGAAVQVKKIALLSADYEYVNYATNKFSTIGSDTYDYTDKNNAIKDELKAANNFRFGAELRQNKLYIRGGYDFYGSTFSSNDINRNMTYNAISLGVGFREQNIYADLGFTRLSNSRNYILYSIPADEVVSSMDLSRNIFALTFGYKFGY